MKIPTRKEVWKAFLANLPRPPTKQQRQEQNVDSVNVLKAVYAPTLKEFLMFFSGFYAWTMDAFDFFSVSLVVTRLTVHFDKPTDDITTSVTLTLLFRSVGALIFGLISDYWGRKWPLIANLIIIAALELASAYVVTFPQFLAVRSLFGIGMGGIWGLAASTSLESMPIQSRGFYSGVLQQGYAVGYLLAAVVNLTVVQDTDDWRTIFYVGAGLSLLCAMFRAVLPETEYFKALKEARSRQKTTKSTFFKDIGAGLKKYWVRCIYTVMIMSGMNFLAHASQDIYPTYLEEAKLFTKHEASLATIVANCGGVVGGSLLGGVSQYLGRRLTIIVCCIWTACWIPLWILPNEWTPLVAGVFLLQMGVQGSWGVIPIFLNEISPPNMRAVWPGVSYQIGNMVSSASAEIIATAGKDLKKTYRGQVLPNYETIQGIFMGVVIAWIIFWCLISKEYHGLSFTEGTIIESESNEIQKDKQEQFEQDNDGNNNSNSIEKVEPRSTETDDIEAQKAKE